MVKITLDSVKHHDNGTPEPGEEHYGDGYTHTFHVHSNSGEHIGTVTHYTTEGGYPRQITYHHMSDGKPTFTSYGAKRWTPIGRTLERGLKYENDFDKDGNDLTKEKAEGVRARNALTQVKSAVRLFARSKGGQDFLAASHFDAKTKGNKTPKREMPKELGESFKKSKLTIIKEAIREQQPVQEQTEAEKHTWFAQQHTKAADQLDGRIATLNYRFNSAAKQSKEFPGVSDSTSIKAHHMNIAIWQAIADGHRKDAAWHTGKAKELTPAVESYVSERAGANFQIVAPDHDDDGKIFTRREDAIARIKKIKKTHPSIRSSIKSRHAEATEEDKNSQEITRQEWYKAKEKIHKNNRALLRKVGINGPGQSIKGWTGVVTHKGKQVNVAKLRSQVGWTADLFRKNRLAGKVETAD